jgi:hypothetical protein
MAADSENVTETRPVRPSTPRVRRRRERRRGHLRLLTVEIPESVIEDAIARGLLKPEESAQAWAVIESVYAAQLSDKALNWLTDKAVIITEQRSNAVAILRCISNWVEQAAAR